MRKLMLPTTAILTLLGTAALAQATNPSADQLINQLKPSGDVGATTRGIQLMAPGNAQGAATATATPASPGATTPAAMSSGTAAPSAITPTASPSANLEITFESGSATLTDSAKAELDQLGKALTSPTLASYNFKIVGHTDTTGTADANQSLSEQRAAAVKSYLESKYNVGDTRLQTSGVGENDLLVQTPPNTPNLQNRRVQIINLGQ